MISSLSGGGAEGVCVNLANSFAKNGWNVDLVLLNKHDEVFLNSLSHRVNLIILNISRARYSMMSILSYIQKNKIKTVLVFNYELTVIIVILRIIFRLNIKIISRNINILSRKMDQMIKQNFWTKYIVKNLIKYFFCKSDHIVNQCEAMRNDLISYFPQIKNKTSIIYNPLSANISNYIKNHDLKIIKKKNYLVCVGRLEKQKAFHYAIEIFSKLVKEFPLLRLKIVGKGSLESKLRQKAIDCKVANKVDFEGYQKNIIPYYLYANGTMLTSIYEGYPNILIESLAMNTPVISFDCPSGPGEIIQNGKNGFLVNYLDLEDFKKKISLLIKNKFDYDNLSKSIEKNKIEYIFKKYENLINFFV